MNFVTGSPVEALLRVHAAHPISIREWSRRSGVHWMTITRILAGQTKYISDTKLRMLLQCFNYDLEIRYRVIPHQQQQVS